MAYYASPVIEHFLRPCRQGTLAAADGVGTLGTVGEGTFVEMSLVVQDGRIAAARFRSFTCPVGVAACDVTALSVEGMTLDEARALTPQAVAAALGGVPEEKMSRCRWAVAALRLAVGAALDSQHATASTSNPELLATSKSSAKESLE